MIGLRALNRAYMVRAANHGELAFLVVWLERLARGPITPLAVSMVRRPPPRTHRYAQLLGPNVRFDAGEDSITCSAASGALALKSASSELSEVLAPRLEALMDAAATTASQRVRAILHASLVTPAPQIEDVAAQLATSVRSLQRALRDEGVSFRALVADARRERAQAQIAATGAPLSEIAFHLGFSEVSAFHRAFKAWTGQTPTAYHRGLVAQPVNRLAHVAIRHAPVDRLREIRVS